MLGSTGAARKGYATPDTLDRLCQVHRNIAGLLDILKSESERFDTSGKPDCEIMSAFADDFLGYPASCHHPRQVGDVEAEHAAIGLQAAEVLGDSDWAQIDSAACAPPCPPPGAALLEVCSGTRPCGMTENKRRRYVDAFRRLSPLILLASLLEITATPAIAEGWSIFDAGSWRATNSETESIYSVAVFAGEGSERDFTKMVSNLHDFDGSGDDIFGLAGGRRLFWFRDQFSIDAELMYAYHPEREQYHEFGVAGYLRWHKFPWNDFVLTSFAVGIGPSYTTILPQIEQDDNSDASQSRLLNQFNVELTLALPEYPRTELLGRIQHRSGFFGTFGGSSEFLTFGVRRHF